MVTTIENGGMAWYFTAWQWGNPSGGNGNEFFWNVSGLTPYIKGGVTNYNLTESQNITFYTAAVWTNIFPIPPTINYLGDLWTNQNLNGGNFGAGWTLAGSLGDGLPATHFRATSTNGSGAWVWYDKFAMPAKGLSQGWPLNSLNYDSAVERFRITVGPDGGATLVGTMNATAFNSTSGTFGLGSTSFLLNSNNVLYWITSTKTNMLSDGR
jgi:hypothetical protein